MAIDSHGNITAGTPHSALMLSECAGGIRSYAVMARAAKLIIDDTETGLRARHSHHRYVIDGPNGAVLLTVPIDKAWKQPDTLLRDVRIVEQAGWRRLHWGALFSSYGKTPFFDFIARELHHIIVDSKQTFLLDFNLALHELVVDFLGLELRTVLLSELEGRIAAPPADAGSCESPLTESSFANHDKDGAVVDFRSCQRQRTGDMLAVNDVPYRQQWERNEGFKPALSVLDIFMNHGREALLTMVKM